MPDSASSGIRLADPSALKQLEKDASLELAKHFERIKKGLAALPGVPPGASRR